MGSREIVATFGGTPNAVRAQERALAVEGHVVIPRMSESRIREALSSGMTVAWINGTGDSGGGRREETASIIRTLDPNVIILTASDEPRESVDYSDIHVDTTVEKYYSVVAKAITDIPRPETSL